MKHFIKLIGLLAFVWMAMSLSEGYFAGDSDRAVCRVACAGDVFVSVECQGKPYGMMSGHVAPTGDFRTANLPELPDAELGVSGCLQIGIGYRLQRHFSPSLFGGWRERPDSLDTGTTACLRGGGLNGVPLLSHVVGQPSEYYVFALRRILI